MTLEVISFSCYLFSCKSPYHDAKQGERARDKQQQRYHCLSPAGSASVHVEHCSWIASMRSSLRFTLSSFMWKPLDHHCNPPPYIPCVWQPPRSILSSAITPSIDFLFYRVFAHIFFKQMPNCRSFKSLLYNIPSHLLKT